jgi:hypothetical protein
LSPEATACQPNVSRTLKKKRARQDLNLRPSA